ncbi:MAG: hypothetical protein L0H88_07100 [Propionibacterium sp.]|nr:hypothetical protein [Propionibacterium sp.]
MSTTTIAAPVTYTAELTAINHRLAVGTPGHYETRRFDTVTIYREGILVDQILVESSEDPAPYDAALIRYLGDCPFEWVF